MIKRDVYLNKLIQSKNNGFSILNLILTNGEHIKAKKMIRI